MSEFLSKVDAPYLYADHLKFVIETWMKPDVANSPIENGWFARTSKYPHKNVYVEKIDVPFWKKGYKAHVKVSEGQYEIQYWWRLTKDSISLDLLREAIQRYEYWENTKFNKTESECGNRHKFNRTKNGWYWVCTECGKVR